MNQNNTSNNINKELEIKEIFSIIWKRKLFVIVLTSAFAISSVIYSLSLPNIYTSQGLLAPTNSKDSLSSKLQGYSSLASFAGIGLPTESASKSTEAIERIQSFDFFSKYFLPNVKVENIMAVKKWDALNNKLIYDAKIFDENSKTWVRKISFPQKIIPSEQESFTIFREAFNVNLDTKTSFILISIEHQSPIIAKKWLDIIIFNINESMRSDDIRIAENSISFLNESQKSVNIQPLKMALSNLLEAQMQTLMLASSSDAYIFKILDAPISPEKKSGPSRALICVLGTLIGGFISLLVIFIMAYKETLESQK